MSLHRLLVAASDALNHDDDDCDCDHDEVNRSPDTGRNAVIGPTRMRLDALWNCGCDCERYSNQD